jgi:nucleotide-binding universal stress UspA family protein
MAGTIVVGIDGSDPGRSALRWAIEEAKARKAAVVAVHVWSFYPAVPPETFDGAPAPMTMPNAGEAIEADSRKLLDRELEAVAQEAAGLDVEGRLVEGNAADALADAGREADLLVVGTKGHGALAGALLGSVSQHLAHHPPCPLVLVPRRDND